MTQRGFLVLADISGFTEFLAQAELDHAQDLIGELLDLIAGRLSQGLTLVEIEGDAVYVYAPDDRFVRGETLLEILESAYLAFRDRLETIRRNTTCDCRACRTIPNLDLKFLVHYGEYVLQTVAGRQKPLGSDVNIVHRLSKNHVTEKTGWRAYLLLTEACLRRLELPQAGWVVQPESPDGLGETRCFVLDLHGRYKELLELRRVVVAEEDADLVMTYDLPAPPPAAWEWLNDPEKRSRWEGLHVYAEGLLKGRSGPGMRTHCVHGKKEKNVHTVLDWRPFDYFTIEIAGAGGVPRLAVNTVRLESFDGGTRVTDLSRALIRPRWLSRLILRRAFEPEMRQAIQRLRDLVSKEGKSIGEVASG